ncbi:hypothetical protein D6C99_04740 [Aureobasidium pullulans]|nr:hypothetical protein D6C99_04740 [Aureobasidium pullulans]
MDGSEPRASTSRNNTRRTNAPGQRDLPPFDIRDMSHFGDSALGDFMYGMEANGFGSMLRNNGVPPMGFDPRDFFGSDDHYDDSTDDDEFPNEQGSSGDGGSSEDNRPPANEVPADNDDSDDDSSSGDSEEEEYWAMYRAEEQKMKLRKQQAKEGTQKHSSIGSSVTSAPGSAPKDTKQTESASTPIASTAEEKSTQARNRGNDLYRKGLFDDATKAYFEALSLTPNDPAPLSNLSAVQFELGNYSGSEVYAEKALKLLEDEEDTNVKKQKLFVRLAKAKILTSKDAALVATKVESSVEKDKILKSMAMNIASKKSSSWSKILDELSIYRPSLEAEGEYYAVGHDPPNPELDSKIISSKGDLSWMFAGIGDARNFFATLIHLDKAEHDKKTKRKFHFSLLDLKAAAMAKVLVLLHLLNQIGDRGALTCLAYVFGSIIMPAFAYDKLQQAVTALVDKLQAGSPVADWIYISEAQRAPLLRQLRSWQQHLDGKYDTATFRQHGLLQASQGKMGRYSTHGAEDHVPPFCERDDVIFWTYGIVMPQGELAAKHEKQLLQLIEGQKLSPRGPPLPDRKITDYIDRNWKPNVTLVDIDWEAKRQRRDSKDPPDFTFNPPELAYVITRKFSDSLICSSISSLVPDIGRVSKYILKFPTPSDDMLNRPHFTVVFWNTSLDAVPTSLRWLLLDDEEGDRSRKAIKIREEGIHILTTFQWSSDTTTASFWLQSDVVMAMQKGDWKAYIWRLDTWQPVTSGVSVRDHIRKLANWNGENISDKNDEEELPIRSASKASTKTANMSSSTQETTPTPIVQNKQTPTIPAHISNDVDRKLVREFQITLMRLVAAADEDVKEPGLSNSVKRVRQAYVRAIAEYRKRTDPSFTPAKPTKFENWPLGELINEVREVECMLLGAPLLPADLKCQMHVAKLVAGTVPSAEVPGKESLSFVEKFDQHIETRKRYDAWKEKQSKEPKEPRQVNPDCAPQ